MSGQHLIVFYFFLKISRKPIRAFKTLWEKLLVENYGRFGKRAHKYLAVGHYRAFSIMSTTKRLNFSTRFETSLGVIKNSFRNVSTPKSSENFFRLLKITWFCKRWKIMAIHFISVFAINIRATKSNESLQQR